MEKSAVCRRPKKRKCGRYEVIGRAKIFMCDGERVRERERERERKRGRPSVNSFCHETWIPPAPFWRPAGVVDGTGNSAATAAVSRDESHGLVKQTVQGRLMVSKGQ